MPSAVKNTFWRITIIFVLSLTIIGLAVPYNDERLFDGTGADISPFVILMDKARIPGINRECFRTDSR
jgi:amino acid transporter